MADPDLIVPGDWPGFEWRSISGPASSLALRVGGREGGDTVLFCHSILTSSAIWHRQAVALAERGYRVACLDMRGHGGSTPSSPPYAMDDLVADAVAALDDLEVARAHVVGVSQGGMIGLGLGVRHPDRVASLCVVAARADAPPPFAAAWDDRIALVKREGGVGSLAMPTSERWFGPDFLASHAEVRESLLACIRGTSAAGFVGCAQAIQGLDYLADIPAIRTRTTLICGGRDTLLLQPMRDLVPMMANAATYEIADSGHLPQLDQPDAFGLLLLAHLEAA